LATATSPRRCAPAWRLCLERQRRSTPEVPIGIAHGASALGGTLPQSERLYLGGLFNLSDLRHSFALIFGADTLLGPVCLAHGWTSSSKDSTHLLVGRTF
jgi:hypothetical protein